MRLPTGEEIAALYQQYQTPPHIQDHMRAVAAIATELGRYHQADLGLVDAAAKLHDLVRIPEQWPTLPATIATPQPHAQINDLILQSAYPEVAAAIRPHSLMTILANDPFPSLEAKLVYYADKRVNHAEVVDLVDRLQLGKQRWQVPAEDDRSVELLAKLTALEADLFRPVPYDPNQLKTHLKTDRP
ncbi:MAG: HD domain-containing protein [Candidatus Kerfeldbacteria bacterium]|nr:HD domain-containing protein [Candidatus Kerfeldbacteria bacterium]